MTGSARGSFHWGLLAAVCVALVGWPGDPGGAQETPKPPVPPNAKDWTSYGPQQVNLRDALVAEQADRNTSGANYGGITALQVRSRTGGKAGTSCRIFVWFDPTKLPGRPDRLEKVVLQLYNLGKLDQPAYAVGDVWVRAYRVLMPWKEGRGKTAAGSTSYPAAQDCISWANQPPFNLFPWAEAKLQSLPAGDKKGYFVNWDITSLVKVWLAGTYPNHGLILIGETEDAVEYLHVFASRESPHGAVVRPKIWVKVAHPPTPQEVQASYQAYLKAYNRLTELESEGKRDTPEGREARREYETAKAIHERLKEKQKALPSAPKARRAE
jgi:hypothetical protein